MYTLNTRKVGEPYLQSHKRWERATGIVELDSSGMFWPLYECVYSWRTGKNAVDSGLVSTDKNNRPIFGVAMPRTDGNIVEKLADRKRYIEELDRNLNPASKLGVTPGQSFKLSSRTDTGHEFGKVSKLTVPISGTVVKQYAAAKSRNEEAHMTGVASWRPTLPAGLTWFPKPSFASTVSASPLAFQKQVSEVFADSAPDAKNASLIVTAIELLRGDLPSVLKNLRKYELRRQSLAKSLGSEYLNIVFGWTPLIKEVTGVVKTFMTLDRLLYYESTRRKRQWDGPLGSSYTRDTNSSAMSTLTSTDTDVCTYEGANRTSGIAWSGVVDQSIVWKEDYHLSARFAGLARPSRAADRFNDQALAFMGSLGLIGSPSDAWELAPFSWLVDWAVNIGSGLENASNYLPSHGGRAIDYAYVTTKNVYSVEEKVQSLVPFTGVVYSSSVTNDRGVSTTTSLVRRRVSPFGVGIDLGDLSGSQMAILVALGLAKSR